MRKLIVLSSDNYVRNLVSSGALDGVVDEDTIWAVSARLVTRADELPGRVVAIPDPLERVHEHNRLRTLMLYAYRSRSRTMKIKARLHPPTRRMRYTLESLPGIQHVLRRRRLRRLGTHPQLHALMQRERPDIVIAPSGGTDTLVSDAIVSARELGIPTLVLIHNWDNLSSKGAFPVKPDYLGVWGEQSAEHAERIHEIPRERVGLLGAPQFEAYFRHRPGSTASPFPFRYVLFAGCYAPFDERDALARLDRAIEEAGLDLTVVYRPHPHRAQRLVDDRVDPAHFRHVVLDPQLEPAYRAHWEGMNEHAKPPLPALAYYPALFEHAELVVCPLSTMLVEAAIFDRRVLVIAYDDGVHPNAPSTVVRFDHFEGVDRIDGFVLVRNADELGPALVATLDAPAGTASPRSQIGWWLHHDERTYAERLQAFLGEIAQREGTAARELLSAARR